MSSVGSKPVQVVAIPSIAASIDACQQALPTDTQRYQLSHKMASVAVYLGYKQQR